MAFNQLVTKTAASLLRHGQLASIARISCCRLHQHSIPVTASVSESRLLAPQQYHRSLVQHHQTRSLRLWKEKTLRAMYWRSRRFDKMPEKLRARSEWQDWNYSAEVYAFAQRLGEPQLTEEQLTRAFTHRSYVSAQQAKQEQLGIADVQINLVDNTELIQQGRDMIEKYTKRYLRYHLRSAPEECIQSLTGYLLSEPVLADVAKWIGCIDMVYCAELPPSLETLANTVPAVIATIAEASGEKRAQNFIVDFILTYLNGVDLLEVWPLHSLDLDLNEYLRQRGEPETEARILHRSAVGTIEACYVVGLYQGADHRLLGQAPGESLPIARRMAELEAFRKLFGLTVSDVRLEFGAKAYDLDLSAFDRDNFSLLEDRSKPSKAASKAN